MKFENLVVIKLQRVIIMNYDELNKERTLDEYPKIQVYGMDFRPMLKNMHEVVVELGLWDLIKEEPGDGGFTFSGNRDIHSIYIHPKVFEDGHSGATQGMCLRKIQYLAQNGWEAFSKLGEPKKEKYEYLGII